MNAPRIVMLDDSKTVLLTSKDALTAAGYEVVTATTPEQLDTEALNGACLILIDVNMPEIFGDDLVRILREQYAVVAPIYLYSTIGSEEGQARASEAGASGFLRKRDPQALVREVTELMAAAKYGKEDEITWLGSRVGPLIAALMEHAEKVEVLVTSGREMDPRILRKAIAVELHSAGGEAALMGHPMTRELSAEIVKRLLDPMVYVPDVCWDQIGAWFRRVCTAAAKRASGGTEDEERGELDMERRELLRALVQTNTPTFRPAAPQEMIDEELAVTGRRILVIDDSRVVRTLLASALGDLGYPVATARDLAEASTLLFEFNPELVITDVSLPGVEGDEICRRIKASSHHLVPVIFYSGLPRQELKRRAEACGADAFINKEEGYDALARCVSGIFRDVVLF